MNKFTIDVTFCNASNLPVGSKVKCAQYTDISTWLDNSLFMSVMIKGQVLDPTNYLEPLVYRTYEFDVVMSPVSLQVNQISIREQLITIQNSPKLYYLSSEKFNTFYPILEQQYAIRNILDKKISTVEFFSDTVVSEIVRTYYSP